ncbi:hypothetical protein D9M68_966530 [compost metagenome]
MQLGQGGRGDDVAVLQAQLAVFLDHLLEHASGHLRHLHGDRPGPVHRVEQRDDGQQRQPDQDPATGGFPGILLFVHSRTFKTETRSSRSIWRRTSSALTTPAASTISAAEA